MASGHGPEGSTLLSMATFPVPRTGVRFSHDQLQVAHWTLHHPQSDRRADLVGMMHMGDAAYYRRVSALVERLHAGGSQIHYELIQKISEEGMANLSPQERSLLVKFRTSLGVGGVGALAGLLGLSLQKSELSYPEGSRNIDMTDLELLRSLGVETLEKLLSAKSVEKFTPEEAQRLLRFVFRYYTPLMSVAGILPQGRRVRQVILHQRNQIALTGARERLSEGDVTLVWGAAHLPGLARDLVKEGFRPVHGEWLSVTTLPPVS